MARNSDGSYDAVDSGGFGKDYHGQDAFGERIGGTGIGGSHFGGKAAGDFSGADELGEGHFTERYTDYGQAMATESPTEVGDAAEVASNMRDTLRGVNEETTENSNTGSMDTSFQIGGSEYETALGALKSRLTDKMKPSTTEAKADIEEDKDKPSTPSEDKEKTWQALEKSKGDLRGVKEWADKMTASLTTTKEGIDSTINNMDSKFIDDKLANLVNNTDDKVIDDLESLAKSFKYDDFDRNKLKEAYKERGTDALREANKEIFERGHAYVDKTVKGVQDRYDKLKSLYESSFTDKVKPAKDKPSTPSEVMKEATSTEAKPGKNMSSAKTSSSDYITKANKDSTKELPKEAPNRNDFGNHAVDTLKGVTDRISDSTTADALGLKSIEEFARENGYDPNKLSTMKAYQSYQNKEIMKAIPGIVKQIGGYIVERVKDAVDPSQLPERIRNTLARYNLATLIGAVILSINSGASISK